MQIAPPDPGTPIWHYVAYVVGTLLLALLVPPVRRRAAALLRRARSPAGDLPHDPGDPQG